jgi:hypothetical protein
MTITHESAGHMPQSAAEQPHYAKRVLLSEECERATRNLVAELSQLLASERAIRAALVAGGKMYDLCTKDEIAARDRVRSALMEVTSMLKQMRVEGIRIIVENEGYRVSDVARLLDHPRQMVKRLYDDGAGEPSGSHREQD